MKEKPDNKTKRQYSKPAVIFSKKIEVLSTVCDTARGGYAGCKKTTPCVRVLT